MNDRAVFLDANVLIYFLDATVDWHNDVIATLQTLLDDGYEFYTSHHVIEEVLFIVSRLSGTRTVVVEAVKALSRVPNLQLVEPVEDIEFSKRYARLYQSTNVGLNDTLLLQLMLDAGIAYLYSYDKAFQNQAAKLGIESVGND